MTGSRLTVAQRVAEAQSDWVKAHSGSKSGRGSV